MISLKHMGFTFHRTPDPEGKIDQLRDEAPGDRGPALGDPQKNPIAYIEDRIGALMSGTGNDHAAAIRSSRQREMTGTCWPSAMRQGSPKHLAT